MPRAVVTDSGKWPKRQRALSAEEVLIRDQWMKIWLEDYMTKPTYTNLLERFNQRYPLRTAVRGAKTLEIGAGTGAHCAWEDLDAQDYYCNELRPELLETLRKKHPTVGSALGDCQRRLDFPDHSFDRVIAIHVLEHLPDLPSALAEIRRLMKPEGRFSVVLPCEGGLAYTLARQFTAKRLFNKRYAWDYDEFIKTEHVNVAEEVIDELGRVFDVEDRAYYPLRVPSSEVNLLIGLTLSPRPGA